MTVHSVIITGLIHAPAAVDAFCTSIPDCGADIAAAITGTVTLQPTTLHDYAHRYPSDADIITAIAGHPNTGGDTLTAICGTTSEPRALQTVAGNQRTPADTLHTLRGRYPHTPIAVQAGVTLVRTTPDNPMTWPYPLTAAEAWTITGALTEHPHQLEDVLHTHESALIWLLASAPKVDTATARALHDHLARTDRWASAARIRASYLNSEPQSTFASTDTVRVERIHSAITHHDNALLDSLAVYNTSSITAIEGSCLYAPWMAAHVPASYIAATTHCSVSDAQDRQHAYDKGHFDHATSLPEQLLAAATSTRQRSDNDEALHYLAGWLAAHTVKQYHTRIQPLVGECSRAQWTHLLTAAPTHLYCQLAGDALRTGNGLYHDVFRGAHLRAIPYTTVCDSIPVHTLAAVITLAGQHTNDPYHHDLITYVHETFAPLTAAAAAATAAAAVAPTFTGSARELVTMITALTAATLPAGESVRPPGK